MFHSAINSLQIGGEGHRFVDHFVKTINGETILGTQNGVRKSTRRIQFECQVFAGAEAGIYVENDGERQLRLFGEYRYFLLPIILEYLKVIFSKVRNRCSMVVGDGHEDVD